MRDLTPFISFLSPGIHFYPSCWIGRPKVQAQLRQQGVVYMKADWTNRDPGISDVSGRQANELTQSRNAAPMAVILDETSETGLLYGAWNTPHMFIIDKMVQLVYMGGIDKIPGKDEDDIADAKNHVFAALDAMAEGKAIEDRMTRPCGSSVKYQN